MDCSSPLHAVLFGHSFLTRLHGYLSQLDHTERDWSNLAVKRSQLAVFFQGQGGLRVRNARYLVPGLLQRNPHIVFLQIGENDLDHRDFVCPFELAGDIFLLARSIQRATGAKHVIVGQLLPPHG